MVLHQNHTYYKLCLMKILCVAELINMAIVSDLKIVSEIYRLQKYTNEFTKEKGNKHPLFSLCCTHDTRLAHGTYWTSI